MTKLKTLKDLDDPKHVWIGENLQVVPTKVLRQEAIKWVKELNNDIDEIHRSPELHKHMHEYKQKTGEYPELLVRTQNKILWIKHFFNITREDLEDNNKGSKNGE